MNTRNIDFVLRYNIFPVPPGVWRQILFFLCQHVKERGLPARRNSPHKGGEKVAARGADMLYIGTSAVPPSSQGVTVASKPVPS